MDDSSKEQTAFIPELVINQEVEEHFKNLWVISPFFLCPLLGHQDLLAVVKSYHRSSTSIYLRKLINKRSPTQPDRNTLFLVEVLFGS
ncbi:hypothetical protein DAPPUDRAFT_250691 [Daphnia pulex]|uniref:Uncharacterized protein n=1 Tax=Daphnia pulex TaxID=6669 RepID=E9GZ46_DAPPU|nr:hypothetical protein DAPPUDRAFT_250691 [Daphnia pulex]|eukprot:EFX75296.1 hypothetical protein DAPPUDRAFT_250691 [Daphnia pulex]